MNTNSAKGLVHSFYATLRQEVVSGSKNLTDHEQSLLRAHYPVIMAADHNPVELAATIYVERRQYPAAAILSTQNPLVFDAGCGYGSESFLFAALGARVIAVDADPPKICIARQRKRYYEEHFQRALDVTFEVADLDEYIPGTDALSLTWVGSVLAAIQNQERFLSRVFDSTRKGGQVMISDMNLWNPLFVYGEWRRRELAKQTSPEFRQQADFGVMFSRRERIGARYYPWQNGAQFDDVQFFSPATLKPLLRSVGFRSTPFYFSGFVPPVLSRIGLTSLEPLFARLPVVSRLGYFYLGIGIK